MWDDLGRDGGSSWSWSRGSDFLMICWVPGFLETRGLPCCYFLMALFRSMATCCWPHQKERPGLWETWTCGGMVKDILGVSPVEDKNHAVLWRFIETYGHVSWLSRIFTLTGQAVLRENNAVQHAAGASWIRLMDPGELNTRSGADHRIRSFGDIFG